MAQTVFQIEDLIRRILYLFDPKDLVMMLTLNRCVSDVIARLPIYQELRQLGTINIFTSKRIKKCYSRGFNHLIIRYHLYCDHCFDIAATNGHINLLQWIYANYSRFKYSDRAIEGAATHSHVYVLDWLINQPDLRFDYPCSLAHSGQHLAVFEWLYWSRFKTEVFTPRSVRTVVQRATVSGQLTIIKWFYQKFPYNSIFVGIFSLAMQHNHVHILQWVLLEKLHSKYTSADIDIVAEHGYVRVLELLHKQKRKIGYVHAISHAINKDHDQILEWFARNDLAIRCNDEDLRQAVTIGNIRVLDQLKKFVKAEQVWKLIIIAASLAHIHVLEWFVSNNFDFSYTMSAAKKAAAAGHTNVFSWFKEHKYQSYRAINSHAVRKKHIMNCARHHKLLVKWLKQNYV